LEAIHLPLAQRWRQGVPACRAVRLQHVQPGIDVRFRSLPNGGSLPGGNGPFEYDLLLAPGADLARFAARCEGVERRAIGRTAAFEQADEPTRRAAIDYLAGARWLVAPDTKRVRLGMRFSEATAWRVNPKVYERFADVADRSRKEAERALAALAGLRG
jgi:hypothetical protein